MDERSPSSLMSGHFDDPFGVLPPMECPYPQAAGRPFDYRLRMLTYDARGRDITAGGALAI